MQGVLVLMKCPKCGTPNRMIVSDRNCTPPSCGKCKELLFSRFAVIFGYVYLLSNPAMPNLLKIGHTRGSLKTRVDQLSAASGIPKPFVVEAYFLSERPRHEEGMVHQALASSRAPGREFFSISLHEALHQCEDVLGRKPQYTRERHGEFREP